MSTITITPLVDHDTKLRFAAALLRLNNPGAAALESLPFKDVGIKLQLSYDLPSDPVVMDEMARLREEVGEDAFLPSKPSILREIHKRMMECTDNEDFERLTKLFANMRGWIEKPGATVNLAVVNNVMTVVDHGSDEEWAEKAANQQRQLVINANA